MKSDLFLKVPPHSLDIEEMILGVFLMTPREVSEHIGDVISDFFYRESHKVIFNAIQKLYDERSSIDILTITDFLRKSKQLESIGGAFALVEMTNRVISSSHIADWVLILKNYYLQREGILLGRRLMDKSYDTDDINSVLNTIGSDIVKSQSNVFKNSEKDVDFFIKELIKQRKDIETNGQIGIDIGFNSLNAVISGLVKPDLIILAARPAQGKTAFMINIILNVLRQGEAVGVFSLEMSGDQLVNRLLSIDSGIDHSDLRKNQMNGVQRLELSRSEGRIGQMKLFIDDTANLNIRDLRTKATLMKRKYDIKFLCIDYLQLMSGVDRKANREGEIAEISRGCKIIAKELGIPVMALSQLSRAVESRPDKMPQLSDLRESGGIEQDADSVLFLMRPETYNISEFEQEGNTYSTKNVCIVKVGKNRHGSLKNIPMKFIGSQMKFEDY